MSDRTLDLPIEEGPQVLVDHLRSMGFTPLTHPNIVRDMMRVFKEAVSAAGVRLEDQISVRFTFDADGVTGAVVTRKE